MEEGDFWILSDSIQKLEQERNDEPLSFQSGKDEG